MDIWMGIVPALCAALWGGEAVYDPGSVLSSGPSPSLAVVGLGDIYNSENRRAANVVEPSLSYTFGYTYFGLKPEVSTMLTGNGDFLIGAGMMNEYKFQKLSLTGDGKSPLFFSWSVLPSYYVQGSGDKTQNGSHLEFHIRGEIGFYLRDQMRLSAAFEHFSNGGFWKPNPDSNAVALRVGYQF